MVEHTEVEKNQEEQEVRDRNDEAADNEVQSAPSQASPAQVNEDHIRENNNTTATEVENVEDVAGVSDRRAQGRRKKFPRTSPSSRAEFTSHNQHQDEVPRNSIAMKIQMRLMLVNKGDHQGDIMQDQSHLERGLCPYGRKRNSENSGT
ncbi:hypothetical protein PIB30_023669 [Stylosanthes scabra]|uniref:Uncharacterized protein n=1 Tax=Stylosanthes scabra TaxID=79078 RepID=A0ABU6S9C1_9FABA|nr:hypothetical protein [Stylosanthes scabra]